MSSWDGKEELVRQSLAAFIQKHICDTSLSSIDDIILSYVVGVLEEIGKQTNGGEAFEVDEFSEMMSAYFPQFVDINSTLVYEWMLDLAGRLSQDNKKNRSMNDDIILPKLDLMSLSDSSVICKESKFDEEELTTKTEDLEETDAEENEEQIKLLQEMFPLSCSMEIQHCLCIAGGNTEKAAQLIMHRQDLGESITNGGPLQSQKSSSKIQWNDSDLRKHILSRYMYVDQSEDKKEHRPVAPKWEPKKLIRYRNNQIVSMKGEKYTEVKEAESEDMKKTYVTLKPARQYRFH